jgi:Zn-dependent protease
MKFHPIPLFKIFGIQVNLDYTWFVVFLLISFTLAEYFYPSFYPDYSGIVYWIFGAISAILLFASVLLHELSHSLVALKFGIPVREINLFIFGGVAMIEEEAHTPREEFLIAIAGPVMSFSIGLFFLIISLLYPVNDIFNGLINYLMYVNFIIGLFNLIPAFPLDGGRVLRSLIWQKKDIITATKITSNIGTYFAYFLMFIGFLYFIQENFINGVWSIFLGLFIRQAAKVSFEETKLSYLLSKYKVEQFMTVVKPLFFNSLVSEILDFYKPFYHLNFFPVIGKDGKFYIVDVNQLKDRNATLEPFLEEITCFVSPYDNLFKALKLMNKCQIDELPVIYKNTFLGIIKRNQIEYLINNLLKGERF